MPERVIESLGVMGWGVGWGWETNFAAAAAVAVAPRGWARVRPGSRAHWARLGPFGAGPGSGPGPGPIGPDLGPIRAQFGPIWGRAWVRPGPKEIS